MYTYTYMYAYKYICMYMCIYICWDKERVSRPQRLTELCDRIIARDYMTELYDGVVVLGDYITE